MAIDFCKNPEPDSAPIKLDFYKPEHVEKLNAEIKAGEVIVEEKKLEETPVVPVVIPEIVVSEPVIEPAVDDAPVIDSGVSEEVAKAINKGRR